MGTVLTNPFELNFGGLAARNAENITFAASVGDTYVQGDITYELLNQTESFACNAFLDVAYQDSTRPFTDVVILKKTHANPGNPTTPYPRYEVRKLEKNAHFMDGWRITDLNGGGCADGCRRLYYAYPTRVQSGEYGSLVDAQNARDDYIFEKNVFRVEDGCTDSSALNYSSGASSNPCPCSVSTPVWTQGHDQSNNPQLQTTAEQVGDCSCLMPPTNLDGHGYLVEKWEFVGTPYPNEYNPNPPYSQLTNQWKWKRNTSKGVLPQPNEEDNLYAIAKEGWRATGLNAPQEFIVKRNLMPNTWEKYRLITATGFEKMGCMDNTAKNYDPEAQVSFTKPDTSSAEVCGTTFDSPLRIACDKQYKLWEKYECEYCTDRDENATVFNQETQKCECKAGYTYQSGVISSKCKKSSAKDLNKGGDKDEEEGISMAVVLAGIVGLTVIGLGVVVASGGPKDE